MATISLESRVMHALRSFVNEIPMEKLGNVGGNRYKAVTMRRKIASAMKEPLESYDAKLEKALAVLTGVQKAVADFRAELDQVEGKSDAEKAAELDAFAEEKNKELEEGMKEFGKYFVYKNKKRPDFSVLSIDDNGSVSEAELTDEQKAFLAEKVQELGVEHFNFEEDLMKVGEALGIE